MYHIAIEIYILFYSILKGTVVRARTNVPLFAHNSFPNRRHIGTVNGEPGKFLPGGRTDACQCRVPTHPYSEAGVVMKTAFPIQTKRLQKVKLR